MDGWTAGLNVRYIGGIEECDDTVLCNGEREPDADYPSDILHATPRDLLRRFLQAYWLRPENAMWMTIRSMVLSELLLDSPAIDVCCGDGVFSFLHAGGRDTHAQ